MLTGVYEGLSDQLVLWAGVEGVIVLGDFAVYFQEDGNACDIINCVIVVSPFVSGCSYNCIACLLRAVLKEVRPHDLTDLFICEEFPNSITCNHNKLMVRVQIKSHDLGVCRNTNLMSNIISNGPTHCKPRHVLIFQPHSFGT